MHVTFAHNAYVANDANGEFAQFVILAIGECLRRSHHDALAGVNAQRVEVFHIADGDAIVETVAHHLIFHLFPALEALLHEHLRRERECFFGNDIEFVLIVAKSASEATEGIGSANNHGVAKFFGSAASILDVLHGFALDGFHAYFVEALHKEFAVLSVHDGLHRSAEHLHAVAFEHTAAIELYAAVEGGLSAKREKHAVGALFFDDALHKVGCYRQEVDLVGNAFGGLHGGNVRVDENGLDAFFSQRLESLRARVVEFARFTYFQCSRTEEQYFLYRVVFHTLQQFHKFIEKKFGIGRARSGFGVELSREPWFALVANALVGAVVHIGE